VAELANAYLDDRARYYADRPASLTEPTYTLRYLLALYARHPAAQFTPVHLRTVRQSVLDAHCGRDYANRVAKQVRRMFRWGVAEGVVHPDVLARLNALEPLRAGHCVAKEPTPRRLVSEEELLAVARHMPGPVAAACWVLFWTGARPAEVLNLRAGDIDRTTDPWRTVLKEHKTAHKGKARVLYFGPRAQAVLRPFLVRPAGAFLFSPAEAVAEVRQRRHTERVTPMNEGNRPGTNRKKNPETAPGDVYDPATFARAVRRAIDIENRNREANSKMEPFSPYCMRHTAATRVAHEIGLEAARALLGHASLSMTLTYARADAEAASTAMSKLG